MSSRLHSLLARVSAAAASLAAFAAPSIALAQETSHAAGGEASLRLPDFSTVTMLGVDGRTLLMSGLAVCALGLAFGFVIFNQLKAMPVHKTMLDISELIYETCKTYLVTQGRFIMILFAFIGAIMVVYYGVFAFAHLPAGERWLRVGMILVFALIGVAGSYGVAWYGIRVNTFANSRTAFASLQGKGHPVYAIPLKAGMSIGMMLISVELMMMLLILVFVPGEFAGPCFVGFAIGESLGASALRIAGGIFTKIADIGSDLMKIVFKIKEDDARNPGVIADCTGDNAGDSVGPSADGFETYGVTGVALISFILLVLTSPEAAEAQKMLLVWLFMIRVVMVVASAGSYLVNEAIAKSRYGNLGKFNFEHPLTVLVWLTSIVSIIATFAVSSALIPELGGASSAWWKLSVIVSCGTLAGAIIPELIKVFTSVDSGHVREVVTASKEGGASLNVLAGLTAGNFSAYWMGIVFVALMGVAYGVTMLDAGTSEALGAIIRFQTEAGWVDVSPIFAFGLVAFGFLGMGPVTIAVDSYGPVTDNAQSVYELSLIENVPNVKEEIKKDFKFDANFEVAKELLEENDGAGNTFKATAKPVLIGTAVVGATTMIFSIIVLLTGLRPELLTQLSLMHPPFLLGMLAGGSVIFWFTGASTQAVSTGAYRAVEFIKANIKLEGVEKASIEDSKKVVEICTVYAQKGMFNIFLTVFFSTLAFAFLESYFFIGYLVAIALFGLFQALFLANAGGAWDNAKKVVETELKAKGTDLHAACVVGDTVGDPFKDTSSVAMNPVIKFTTLFGLLAVELAEILQGSIENGATMRVVIAAVLFAISAFFVYRSFYGMRIAAVEGESHAKTAAAPAE
ncbi:sodium-translocating pyrophosphatase [Sandaracinus amylolyticus]|uniref:sodium-translocating pyrophosphatase n=1 Tax=Sandaracinus amylolyticus TaxID=927083 RepID=UPI001F1AEE96|nr:Sodium-translocating pyrophosphatase [Sandaracinus amylolyticus]